MTVVVAPHRARVGAGVLLRIEEEEKTAGGIIIPDTAKEKPQEGKVIVDIMIPYVEDMLEEFPKKLQENETVMTPAADNLFSKGHGKKLNQERADIFHRIVAKGLFISKRARPDIQPMIAGLCTRVKEPDGSNWSKLVRLMKYLNGTRKRKLTLSADNL